MKVKLMKTIYLVAAVVAAAVAVAVLVASVSLLLQAGFYGTYAAALAVALVAVCVLFIDLAEHSK